jgi:hypothetical protein
MGGCISPPVVSRSSPSAAVIIDGPGGSRVFSATVSYLHPEDAADTVFAMYFDGVYVGATLSHEFQAIGGYHTVRAVASNPCGSSDAYWGWYVLDPGFSLDVSLSPNGTLVEYGTSSTRTFTATANLPAEIMFYFNDVAQPSTFGTTATFTCTNAGTHHTIRVVASILLMSDEDSCSWWVLPSVQAPEVTLSPHGIIYEFGTSVERTFTATVDQPAEITFYFDDVAQQSVYGQSASFTCANAATHHIIRVVASNPNGSDQDSCSWWVFADHNFANPPVVTLITPPYQQISDLINTTRQFDVSIDQPVEVIVYLDDTQVTTSAFGIQAFSFLLTAASPGSHIVRVVAINSNGIGENYWIWTVNLEGAACPIEGQTKCVGYDLYRCQNGSWALVERNSPYCGYPSPPLPRPAIDQACWEFMAQPGKHIYGLRYRVKMNKLPHKITGSDLNEIIYTGDAWFFVATHAYLFEDHDLQKGAIGRRVDIYDNGIHSFTTWGVYFNSTNAQRSLLCNEWREQWIELDPYLNTLKAYTLDDSGNTILLGQSDGVTANEILHVDFMAEIQYFDTMSLPAVALDENVVHLLSVKTDDGWLPPEDCLTLRTYSVIPPPENPRQGAWAKILDPYIKNPDNTWTFKFGIQR